MSLLVFPTFGRSQGFNYKYPVQQTPVLSTIVQVPNTQRGEVRIPNMAYPRWRFNYNLGYILGDATQTASAWQTLTNFFIAVQGQASDWLFLKPDDNTIPSASPQNIGTGTGSNLDFVMYRTLVSGGALDLIQNFVSAPTIYVNGSSVSSSTYTIDQYGNLTFNAGHAPGNTQAVAWSGQFYYRCRFETDEWSSLKEVFHQIWTNEEVKFISVLI